MLLQVRYLNEALRRFDILLIVPVYQTFWILSGTVAGLIYFKEYLQISHSVQRTSLFFTGVVLALFGVALLARGARAQEEKRESLRQSLLSTGSEAVSGVPQARYTTQGTAAFEQRDSVVEAFSKYMERSSYYGDHIPIGKHHTWSERSEYPMSGVASNLGSPGRVEF